MLFWLLLNSPTPTTANCHALPMQCVSALVLLAQPCLLITYSTLAWPSNRKTLPFDFSCDIYSLFTATHEAVLHQNQRAERGACSLELWLANVAGLILHCYL